jgi:hypothetical protein
LRKFNFIYDFCRYRFKLILSGDKKMNYKNIFSLLLLTAVFSIESHAQSCLRNIHYSAKCSTSTSRLAYGYCSGGGVQSVFSSTCISNTELSDRASAQCKSANRCVASVPVPAPVPPPPPPPAPAPAPAPAPVPPTAQSHTSTVVSLVASQAVLSSLTAVTMSHSTLDPINCINQKNTYSVALNNTDSRNSGFLNKVSPSSTQWYSVTLTCPSAPVSKKVDGSYSGFGGGGSTLDVTYPSGCYVLSFAPTAKPPPLNCY